MLILIMIIAIILFVIYFVIILKRPKWEKITRSCIDTKEMQAHVQSNEGNTKRNVHASNAHGRKIRPCR